MVNPRWIYSVMCNAALKMLLIIMSNLQIWTGREQDMDFQAVLLVSAIWRERTSNKMTPEKTFINLRNKGKFKFKHDFNSMYIIPHDTLSL